MRLHVTTRGPLCTHLPRHSVPPLGFNVVKGEEETGLAYLHPSVPSPVWEIKSGTPLPYHLSFGTPSLLTRDIHRGTR